MAFVAENPYGNKGSVGRVAAEGDVCDKPNEVASGLGEGVLRVALSGGASVTEIPLERVAAAGVIEGDGIGRFAAYGRNNTIGHGIVVMNVETEECVVTVVAQIVIRPGILGSGESVVSIATGTDTLV